MLHNISHISSQGILVFLFHVCLDKEVQLEIRRILKPKRKATFGSNNKKNLLRFKQKPQIKTEDTGRNLSVTDAAAKSLAAAKQTAQYATVTKVVVETTIYSQVVADLLGFNDQALHEAALSGAYLDIHPSRYFLCPYLDP